MLIILRKLWKVQGSKFYKGCFKMKETYEFFGPGNVNTLVGMFALCHCFVLPLYSFSNCSQNAEIVT